MDKIDFAAIVVVVVGLLQGFAWYSGKNGVVFAATSAIIGLTAGAILGFKFPSSKE